MDLSFLPEEIEVVKLMNEAPKLIQEAADNLSPALLANYLYELVKSFNHFYQNVSIFNEENKELANMRLILAKNVGDIIANFTHLLGMKVPQKM
jgi:arginyl-tRNA synthetase